jgi:hypothetical protein
MILEGIPFARQIQDGIFQNSFLDHGSRLQGNSAGVIDSVQEDRYSVLREILIAGLPGPSPMAIVIDNDYTVLR